MQVIEALNSQASPGAPAARAPAHAAGQNRSRADEPTPAPAQRRISKLLVDNLAAAPRNAVQGVGQWLGVSGSRDTMEQWHQQHLEENTGRQPNRLSTAYGKRAQNLAMRNKQDMGDDDSDDEKVPINAPLIHDQKEAIAHYRGFVARERLDHKKHVEPGWAQANVPKRESKGKFDQIDFDRLQTRKKMEINRLLERLPEHHSIFISIISLAQLIIFVTMFGIAYKHLDIAPFNLATGSVTCSGTSCPATFACETCYDTTAKRQSVSNLWYGPNLNTLLKWGAKFSPCMRRDTAVYTSLAQVREQECGVLPYNLCENGGQNGFSCCTLANYRSGMTSFATCTANGGTWAWPNQLCPVSANIVLRPCCTGFTGTCSLVTEEQCIYQNGIYHAELQLCSQVDCLALNCRMISGESLASDPLLVNVPTQPNQFWRVFTAMLTHAGLIQLIIAVGFQYHLGVDIERKIGTLRVMIIYIGSGIGGFLVSSIFVPYEVTNGCDTPVFGLVALLIIDVSFLNTFCLYF